MVDDDRLPTFSAPLVTDRPVPVKSVMVSAPRTMVVPVAVVKLKLEIVEEPDATNEAKLAVPVKLGEAEKTATPVPVSSDRAPKSSADVMSSVFEVKTSVTSVR